MKTQDVVSQVAELREAAATLTTETSFHTRMYAFMALQTVETEKRLAAVTALEQSLGAALAAAAAATAAGLLMLLVVMLLVRHLPVVVVVMEMKVWVEEVSDMHVTGKNILDNLHGIWTRVIGGVQQLMMRLLLL